MIVGSLDTRYEIRNTRQALINAKSSREFSKPVQIDFAHDRSRKKMNTDFLLFGGNDTTNKITPLAYHGIVNNEAIRHDLSVAITSSWTKKYYKIPEQSFSGDISVHFDPSASICSATNDSLFHYDEILFVLVPFGRIEYCRKHVLGAVVGATVVGLTPQRSKSEQKVGTQKFRALSSSIMKCLFVLFLLRSVVIWWGLIHCDTGGWTEKRVYVLQQALLDLPDAGRAIPEPNQASPRPAQKPEVWEHSRTILRHLDVVWTRDDVSRDLWLVFDGIRYKNRPATDSLSHFLSQK